MTAFCRFLDLVSPLDYTLLDISFGVQYFVITSIYKVSTFYFKLKNTYIKKNTVKTSNIKHYIYNDIHTKDN